MKKTLLFMIMGAAMGACSVDNYEKGEGKYSQMRGDFAELASDATPAGVRFTTDDGDSYALTSPYYAQWIATADSTYRVVVYYNVKDGQRAECVQMSEVGTLEPIAHWRFKQMPRDPLELESAWMSKSGKYLNLGLLVRNGFVDDVMGRHVIGLSCDTVLVEDNQRRTAYYELLHDQGDAPAYYTERGYVSILLPAARPDSIVLTVPTDDGPRVRCFSVR